MKVVECNQLEKARSLKVGEVSIVGFDDYDQYRSFTVQLSHYNASRARKKGLFVHAASKKTLLQYCLVTVSLEDRMKEESDYSYKNHWKERIPQVWKRAQ